PDQLYFARDASIQEQSAIENIKKAVHQGTKDEAFDVSIQDIRDNNFEIDANKLLDFLSNESLSDRTASERTRWFSLFHKTYAMDRGFVKPFRSYHIATSANHIMY